MTTLTQTQVKTMTADCSMKQIADLEGEYGQRDEAWIASHCRIVDKQVNECQLKANTAQVKLQRALRSQQQAGKPIRIIILKARQQGMTTWGLGLQFKWCNTKSNRNALMSAHDDDQSIEIFRKVRMFQDCNPRPLKELYSNRKEITYAGGHRSTLLVKTAGKEDLGRGSTIHYFHGSEVAFWANAKQTLLAVLQCIPKANPETAVLLESTANGIGGEFYDRWQAAKAGKSSYIPVFLPWWDFAEYRAEAPADGIIPDADEMRLIEEYGLDDAQIQWRRETIQDECGGDDDMFKQEYPSDDEEAFLVSGRPVFPQTQLKEMFDNRQPPKWVGKLQRKAGSYDEVEFIEDPTGWLEVWQKPQPDRLYAIGSDSCEGKDPDESNDPDAHSAHVLDVSFKKLVAKITGRMDTDVYGDQLGLLGWWYGAALIGPETNNTSGGAVLKSLRDMDYPHIYTKKTYKKHAEKWTEEIGWRTDQITREIMISDLVKAIRQGWLYVYSEQTIHQMRMFMRDKTGKPTHPPGEHDDDVISLAITLQMAIAAASCMTLEGYATNKWEDKGIRRYNQDGSFSVDDLAVVGAVDTFEDLDWEDEDEADK